MYGFNDDQSENNVSVTTADVKVKQGYKNILRLYSTEGKCTVCLPELGEYY